MNSTEICNTKTEVAKGLVLTDKDYIEGILTVCKELEKNLTVALTEASHEKLYQTIFEMFTDIADLQRETYELWFRKGWFVVEAEPQDKIMKKLNKLEQEFTDLDEESYDEDTEDTESTEESEEESTEETEDEYEEEEESE